MKRLLRWLCPALFLIAAIAVIGFLHLFTKVDETMTFINWDSSVHVLTDGTEEQIADDVYRDSTMLSGTYRFTGVLPEGLGEGSLLFETNGASLTLSLNGEIIWQSQTSGMDGSLSMAQGTVPIPDGTYGELELTCTILDGSRIMFPPLLRFVPENLNNIESTALANRAAFTAGAAALALVLVFGVFLLSIVTSHPDMSLIPLCFAMALMIPLQLVQSEGSYFLSDSLAAILGRQEMGFVVLALLMLYLFMNRKRHLLKYFGIAFTWSAIGFIICLLISGLCNGYLFDYILNSIIPDIQAGYYSGLLYWLSLWLCFTSALISAFGVLQAYSHQAATAQALQIKSKLMEEGYHALQERIEADAKTRHEWKHQLTVLDCLCKNQDLSSMSNTLKEMLQQQRMQIMFTGNILVNTILQDAAARAERSSIKLETQITIPDELPFQETDLSSLLMNLIDNAIEAAEQVMPVQDRYLSICMNMKAGYLSVVCKNTFTGELKTDHHGNLLTIKEDKLSHGFGYSQMKKITQKYDGFLRYHTEDTMFVLEAALQMKEQ